MELKKLSSRNPETLKADLLPGLAEGQFPIFQHRLAPSLGALLIFGLSLSSEALPLQSHAGPRSRRLP